MKRIIALLVCIMILLCGFAVNAEEVWSSIYVKINDINVSVNGTLVNARNFVYEGTTYLSLRDMGTVLGYYVSWDEETKTAFLMPGAQPSYDFIEGAVSEGEIPVLVNDVNIIVDSQIIDARNFVHEGTTYLSLRDIGNATNYNVSWDEETRTAVLTSKFIIPNEQLTGKINNIEIPSIYLYATQQSVANETEEVIKKTLISSATQFAYISEMAEKYNITLTEAEEKTIEDAFEEFLVRVGGMEEVEKTVTAMGYSTDDYIDVMKTELRFRLLFDKINLHYLKNDEEVDKLREESNKAYDENKEQYYNPTVTVKHILIPADSAEEMPAAKKKAEEILGKLKKGEAFDKLLAENNNDPGQPEEGYYIYENAGFVESFEKAALALKKGEISDVVESEFGYHIIYALDRIEYLPKEDVFLSLYEDKIIERISAIFTQWDEKATKTFGWE